MRISKIQLKHIIQEELTAVLFEQEDNLVGLIGTVIDPHEIENIIQNASNESLWGGRVVADAKQGIDVSKAGDPVMSAIMLDGSGRFRNKEGITPLGRLIINLVRAERNYRLGLDDTPVPEPVEVPETDIEVPETDIEVPEPVEVETDKPVVPVDTKRCAVNAEGVPQVCLQPDGTWGAPGVVMTADEDGTIEIERLQNLSPREIERLQSLQEEIDKTLNSSISYTRYYL